MKYTYSLQITYKNGFTHIFGVITRKIYEEVIKPIRNTIYEIECLNKKQFKKRLVEYGKLNAELKTYGEFCVENSPIALALNDNILHLGPNQGGDHKVKIFKL